MAFIQDRRERIRGAGEREPVDPAKDDLVRWRDQAAAAFLFLSGCRSSAFATLTLGCVDIPGRVVIQDPTRGVRTKRKKSAVTHLLEIADLLEFVSGWDTYVRSQLESGYWYTVIDPVTLKLTPDEPGQFRAKILSRGLARLFAAAGLPAMSPHKSGAGAGNLISGIALFAPAPGMAMRSTVSCMRGTWPTSRR